MIFHLFPGEKIHHVPHMIDLFTRFSRRMGTEANEQTFILYGTDREHRKLYRDLALPPERLVFESGGSPVKPLLCRPGEEDILVIHGLFLPGVWLRLLLSPRRWKRTALIHWGGGLEPFRVQYEWWKKRITVTSPGGKPSDAARPLLWRRAFAPPWNAGRKSLKMFPPLVDQFLKKLILPRLKVVATMTPGEFRVLGEWYGVGDNYAPVVYCTFLPEFASSKPSSEPRRSPALPGSDGGSTVLLGNSAWESNGHLEVLQQLARFRDEPLWVICPLGYPRGSGYRNEVVRAGRDLLGDRFIPLLRMLPRAEYSALLATVDVTIQNAGRQQGLYCIYRALLHGGKIYLCRESPTFEMLESWGARVFDVREIASCPYGEFSSLPPEAKEQNRRIARDHLSLEASLDTWRRLFGKFTHGKGGR